MCALLFDADIFIAFIFIIDIDILLPMPFSLIDIIDYYLLIFHIIFIAADIDFVIDTPLR
jgi:hypothetical protein